MKKILFILNVFIIVAFIQPVSAAPYLYTFSGSIDYIEIDGLFYSDIDFDGDYNTLNDNFRVGEELEYVFLVDFDLAGFCDGPLNTSYSETCTGAEIPDDQYSDYFYTRLYSASKLAPATEEGTTFNYGLNLRSLGWLAADSAVFIISPYQLAVNKWVAKSDAGSGSLLMGVDAWAKAYGSSPFGRINSTLELISIIPYVETTFKGVRNTKCVKKSVKQRKGKKRKAHKWKKACK